MEASDIIQCLLCTCPADRKNRRTFPSCRHTYCYECLDKHCLMLRRSEARTSVFDPEDLARLRPKCPVCLQDCDGFYLLKEIPPTHDVFSLCQDVTLSKKTREKEDLCDGCSGRRHKKKKPIFKCDTCNQLVCGRCCQDHKSGRHQLLKWNRHEERVLYQCKRHKREISQYCTDCRVLVCDRCGSDKLSPSHRHHKFEGFAELLRSQKEKCMMNLREIKQLIQEKERQKECCSRLAKQREKTFRQVKQEIQLQMNRLIESIKTNGTHLLQQVSMLDKQIQTLVDNHVTYLDYRKCMLNNLQNFIHKIMQPSNEPIALLHRNDVDLYIRSQKRQLEHMKKNVIDKLRQVPNFTLDVNYSKMNGITLGHVSVVKQSECTVDIVSMPRPEDIHMIPGGQRLWKTAGSYDNSFIASGLIFVDHHQGHLLVAEHNAGQIAKYEKDGKKLDSVITKEHFRPRDLTLNRVDKLLYVTDSIKGTVHAFNETGKVVPFKNSLPDFKSPSGIATNGQYIVISDTMKRTIEVIKTSGEFVRTIEKDHSSGQFGRPEFLILDDKDNIVVSDNMHNQIYVYDIEGRCLLSFGQSGTGPGDLQHPTGIGQDPFGHYLVVDSDNSRVCRFRQDGTYDCTVLEFAAGLFKPYAIAVSDLGDVAITDQATDCIAAYMLYNLRS